MKTCKKCNETKHFDDFYRESQNKDGYRNSCKDCEKSRTKAFREDHPELYKRLFRNKNLKALYGITIEDFEALLLSQDNRCAICKDDNPTANYGWQVDHDHETNKVRGILCHWCNIAVGQVENGWPLIIPEVEKYLEVHRNAIRN